MSPTSHRRPDRRRGAALFLALVAISLVAGAALVLGRDEAKESLAATVDPTTTAAPTTSTASTTTSTTTTSTTTTTTTPPPLRSPTPAAPLLVWTLGDSTAQTVGDAVQIALRGNPTITTRTSFRISSGLARPDFFDWSTFVALFTLAQKPDAVIISIGANDAQGVSSPDGAVHAFGSPGWKVEYRRRADEAMRLFTDAGIEVYWMGQPLARDVEYTRWMSLINTVYREAAAANPHVTFLNTSQWLIDGRGRFAPTLDGEEVRTRDGIHLTAAGGSRVARHIVAAIGADIAPPPPPPPSPATSLAPTTSSAPPPSAAPTAPVAPPSAPPSSAQP